MTTETTMHPLDAAEIELKQAARQWVARCQSSTSASDVDAAWLRIKDAARAYGETWTTYVADPEPRR